MAAMYISGMLPVGSGGGGAAVGIKSPLDEGANAEEAALGGGARIGTTGRVDEGAG